MERLFGPTADEKGNPIDRKKQDDVFVLPLHKGLTDEDVITIATRYHFEDDEPNSKDALYQLERASVLQGVINVFKQIRNFAEDFSNDRMLRYLNICERIYLKYDFQLITVMDAIADYLEEANHEEIHVDTFLEALEGMNDTELCNIVSEFEEAK